MDLSAKSNALQTYQILLYDRALHPELFTLHDRRVIKAGGYEFEAWLMRGAHLLRFERGPICASELVTDQDDHLPQHGVLTCFPCAGEREHDYSFPRTDVNYMTSVQTETLSENLYLNTLEELRAFGHESSAMMHAFADSMGPCLSMLDIQRYSTEVHVQSYHLLANPGLVLRTQTIFEQRG